MPETRRRDHDRRVSRVEVSDPREGEILDITEKTQRIVGSSKLKNGVATLFVPGSTGALTTIEYEPGLLADFPRALERLVPKSTPYEHENRWHDGNGHSLWEPGNKSSSLNWMLDRGTEPSSFS